ELSTLDRAECDEDLVADEVVIGLRTRRRRVLDADEANRAHLAQPVDEQLRERALARPRRRIKFERHDEWPSARRARGSCGPGGTRRSRTSAQRRQRPDTGGWTRGCTGRGRGRDEAPNPARRRRGGGTPGKRAGRWRSRDG